MQRKKDTITKPPDSRPRIPIPLHPGIVGTMENKAGLRASPALVEFGYFCEESETRGDALGATICAPITSPETTNSTRRFC